MKATSSIALPEEWLRTGLLTTVVMLAFAGNSILCRLALKGGHIDPLSFSLIRLFSGACVLALLVCIPAHTYRALQGSWIGALTLFGYAVTFSLAYVEMDAGPGALILFAAVPVGMLAAGLLRGERLGPLGVFGLVLSMASLAMLLLPGSTAPPLGSAVLMLAAGISWAGYSIHGKRAHSPAAATAGNFARATLLALLLIVPFLSRVTWDSAGAAYAVFSGAVTSGLGYALWYRVVRQMSVTRAGIVQLSVPVLSVLGGIWWLQEPLTFRVVLSSIGVLGGVAIVLMRDIPYRGT